ncbi:MAG: hypothetical protein M3Q49_01680 [Actinomycetota bacterium]|nr:hypothetical protein [Actinomycetota bacterium]
MALVGFCGSRSLPPESSALVAGVVRSVLRSGRGIGVGCALGADALVVSSALAAGAASRLSIFAAFGPVSPPWPASRVSAPGASSAVSSVPGVAEAIAAGASVRWWAGGGPSVPLSSRLASRSSALVCTVASSGDRVGLVGFVSSPCPSAVVPSASPSRCFSGSGSGSWATLALAAGLGIPVVVFPVGLPPSALPVSSWGGSFSPLAGAWSGGFRFVGPPPPASLF